MHVERINPDASRRNAHYNLLLLHRYCRQRHSHSPDNICPRSLIVFSNDLS
jgi:hypothetical protein